MKRKSLSGLLAAIGIVAAPMGVVTFHATPAAAEDATHCLNLEGNQLVNSCGYTIEATWCTEDIDCNNGRFTNTWTIGAYRSYPVRGGDSGNTVHSGACRGANTLSANGTSAYSWEFVCSD